VTVETVSCLTRPSASLPRDGLPHFARSQRLA